MTTSNPKTASPDTLFARFLQRKAKKPTDKQIHTWENDGGNADVNDDFVIINGTVCKTFTQKVKAYITKYFRLFRMQFHNRIAHHEHHQPN